MEIWNDGDFDAARDVRRRHDRQKVLRDGVSIIVVPPIDGWVAGRWDSAMGRCTSWERRDLRSALVSVFGNEQSWLEIEANG